jgi:tetratricopeptide (TPR) repeat protein
MGSGKNLKFFYSQYMSMQFGKLISCICLFAALCILMHPVAAATQPDEATIYYNAGVNLLNQGQLERAISQFDKALAANTSIIEYTGAIVYLYSDKSAALFDLGRYSEAVDSADKGITYDNRFQSLWRNKGLSLSKLGRYQDAVDAFDHAIAIDSTSSNSTSSMDFSMDWKNKGDSLYSLGRYQDAVNAYTSALSLDSGNSYAAEGLARAQQKSSDISPVMIIAVIALIVVGCGVAYYVLKKKPSGDSAAEKKGKKK